MLNNIILILVIVFSVVISGLFSGAETGIYRLSRLRLRLGIEKKRLSFIILGKSLRDSSALLLSILIGTNIGNYVATGAVTYFLLRQMEVIQAVELIATLLTAPLLFVFSEVIPKNIFFYRSNTIMPYIAPVLFAFHKIFNWCGAVPLLKSLSRVFARLTVSPLPSDTAIAAAKQSHIKAIIRDTSEEAFLSPVQTDIMNRLASISHLGIKSVMTPISKVEMVERNSGRSALLNKLKKTAFSRLLVYEHRPANIIGFVNVYETLTSSEEFTDLRNFIRPIQRIPSDTVVTDAINLMQTESQKIALVTRSGHSHQERPIGIITMKDLVEELLGELAEW